MRRWTAEIPRPGIVVHQPESGFRYSVDAFWLAGFALEPGVPQTALDVCTGSGIVAFLLARRGCETRGVDAFPGWSAGWEKSLADSEFRPELRWCAVEEVRERADLVTCNPPYFAPTSGPVSTDPFRAAGRTESVSSLASIVASCVRLARQRAIFVVPRDRESEVLEASRPYHLVRRIRIGRKRSLLDLRPEGVLTEDVHVERDDPRVQRLAG